MDNEANTPNWTEKAEALLTQLMSQSLARELTEAEQDMLSLVVNDALHGIDIQKQYPAFYQKLTVDGALRDAFLEIMEMVSEEDLEPAPLPLSIFEKLPFLATPAPHRTFEALTGPWRLTWQQTVAQLNALFLSRTVELASRADTTLDDPWYILIRDQVDLANVSYNIFLEAAQQDDVAEELQLALALAVHAPSTETLLPIKATLTWGTYHEQMTISVPPRT
ncbi:MAG TPA: hypothetical protein PK530_04335, partial [Anaerolineales bacterium]|nr:hypothetical protein [Anaerolineales bacterium]